MNADTSDGYWENLFRLIRDADEDLCTEIEHLRHSIDRLTEAVRENGPARW